MNDNKQYMNFLSAYYHFMSIVMADKVDTFGEKKIIPIYHNEKMKHMDDEEIAEWKTGELDKIIRIIGMAKDEELNLFLSRKVDQISWIIVNSFVNGTMTMEDKLKINDLFLKGVESFKFDEFMKCMKLDRKKFEIRNASELDNYCEIYCVDKTIYSEDQMIWCGDFVSRKKLGQRTIKDFHFSVDGDYFVAQYLTNLWIKYNDDLHKAVDNGDIKANGDYGREVAELTFSKYKRKLSRAERRKLERRKNVQI